MSKKVEEATNDQIWKKIIQKHKTSICSRIIERLRKRLAKASKMAIYYVRDSHYEVKEKLGSYTLVLNKRTCNCKVWDMSWISCVHVCVAIQVDHGKIENYLHRCLARKHGQEHMHVLQYYHCFFMYYKVYGLHPFSYKVWIHITSVILIQVLVLYVCVLPKRKSRGAHCRVPNNILVMTPKQAIPPGADEQRYWELSGRSPVRRTATKLRTETSKAKKDTDAKTVTSEQRQTRRRHPIRAQVINLWYQSRRRIPLCSLLHARFKEWKGGQTQTSPQSAPTKGQTCRPCRR